MYRTVYEGTSEDTISLSLSHTHTHTHAYTHTHFIIIIKEFMCRCVSTSDAVRARDNRRLLTHLLTHLLTYSLTHLLTHWHSLPVVAVNASALPAEWHTVTQQLNPWLLTTPLPHCPTHSLTHSLTHVLPHSLTYLLTHSLTYSLRPSPPPHSLTYSDACVS
jgi:hypothetical protein